MKSITEILSTVIRHDPALTGFKPDDLPEAAKARINNCRRSRSLDTDHTHEELIELEKWIGGFNGRDNSVFQAWEGECAYFVFADGSLYFMSSGDSEVWADAGDFAIARILNGYEGPLGKMDAELLGSMGASYLSALEERGTR